jgi:ribosomal protein S18 acetylase RimI-like enzyme
MAGVEGSMAGADRAGHISSLDAIDRYLDAVPRSSARVETIGPFTLFVGTAHGWRYYARPTPGAEPGTPDDVRAVRRRQRELEQPEAFEWIVELAPWVADAIAGDGLALHEHPLMTFAPDVPIRSSHEHVDARIVGADEDVAILSAVAEVAFRDGGTGVGTSGTDEARTVAAGQPVESVAFQRDRMRKGLTVAAAAFVDGAVAAVGWHNPLGDATELVGIATLPAFRRRGLGLAVTELLVRDARARGIGTVFLSAGDDDIARVYARAGARRIATAGAAEPRPR